jgi:hypothetical protein
MKSHAAAWLVCLLSTLAAVVLFRATDTGVYAAPLTAMVCVILVLGSLHVLYTWIRPDPYIGPVAGGLAVVCWGGLVAGMSALAGLRAGAPLIDTTLAHVDAMLGIDVPAGIAWISSHFAVAVLLDIAYISTVPLVFVAVVGLGWSGHYGRMWELGFSFAGSAAVIVLVAAMMPAIGTFTHYRISADTIGGLPPGAGRYFVPIFDAFRSGAVDTVDIRQMSGVVEFPSFHAAMAIMLAYSVRGMRWVSWPAWIWCGVTLVSTIPIGGHYFVDLPGGALVWAAFAAGFARLPAEFKPFDVDLAQVFRATRSDKIGR